MKKIIFYIFVSLFSLQYSQAQTKKNVSKTRAASTSLVFDKAIYNYGTVKQGDVIKYDFTFKNIGKKPIDVKNATATCGCTVPSYPFIPVMPNETATIGVTFDTKHKMGPQKPIVTVITSVGTYKVTLEGFVTE
jgi:hypothetical protein